MACGIRALNLGSDRAGDVLTTQRRISVHVRVHVRDHDPHEHHLTRFTETASFRPYCHGIREIRPLSCALCKQGVAGSSPAGSTLTRSSSARGYDLGRGFVSSVSAELCRFRCPRRRFLNARVLLTPFTSRGDVPLLHEQGALPQETRCVERNANGEDIRDTGDTVWLLRDGVVFDGAAGVRVDSIRAARPRGGRGARPHSPWPRTGVDRRRKRGASCGPARAPSGPPRWTGA